MSNAAEQPDDISEPAASVAGGLAAGQVDAILGSVTYGLVIQQTGNEAQYGRKYKVSDNFQGMAVRKGDQEMLDFLNDFVTRHTADGTLDALYKKWIGVDRAIELLDRPFVVAGIEGRHPGGERGVRILRPRIGIRCGHLQQKGDLDEPASSTPFLALRGYHLFECLEQDIVGR